MTIEEWVRLDRCITLQSIAAAHHGTGIDTTAESDISTGDGGANANGVTEDDHEEHQDEQVVIVAPLNQLDITPCSTLLTPPTSIIKRTKKHKKQQQKKLLKRNSYQHQQEKDEYEEHQKLCCEEDNSSNGQIMAFRTTVRKHRKQFMPSQIIAILAFMLVVEPTLGLDFFCFVNEGFNVDLLLNNFPKCSHLVIKNFIKIGNGHIDMDYLARNKAHYWKAAAPPFNIKLFAEFAPKSESTMIFPIGQSHKKIFLRKLKSAVRYTRSLNPLNGKPLFSGLFFRADSFQKEGNFFEFSELLAKIREEKLHLGKSSCGEIALEIDAQFEPHTIGFPTNSQITSLVDLFYLKLTPDEMLMTRTESRLPITFNTVQLNPLFVSKFVNPKLSVIFQKEKLDKFKIDSQIIVGFSSVGYEMKKQDGAFVQKLNTSMICASLNDGQKSVFYDRQSFSTSFIKEKTFVIFNMAYHKSLKEKIRWVFQNGFYGVGLDSLEADSDPNNVCSYENQFPLHDYFGKIIGTLETELKKKETLAKMSQESWTKVIQMRTDEDRPVNGHVHQIGRISSPMKAMAIETDKFYEKQTEKIHPNVNVTDETAGAIANLVEEVDDLKCNELCGVSDELFIESNEQGYRTIGGEQLTENSFPWIVFVRVQVDCPYERPSIFIHCTGVLVSMNHVVTAAHCMFLRTNQLNECLGRQRYFPNSFRKIDVKDVLIHFGSISMSKTKIEKVSKITIGTSFEMSNENTLRTDDYAILKLTRTLDRKADNVVPICLIDDDRYGERMGEIAMVIGYGGEYDDTSLYTNKSQTVTYVPMKTADYCNNLYTNQQQWNYQHDKFICAGGRRKGFTYGDCGGPLMIERNGLYYLKGLVMSSFPSDSVFKKYLPDVYTRMNSHGACLHLAQATDNRLNCKHQMISSGTLKELCDKEHAQLLAKDFQRSCEYETDIYGRCRMRIQPFHTHN